MADQPDVLKRLDKIEGLDVGCECYSCEYHLDWLINLTRALLESQGELAAALLVNCRHESKPCPYCTALIGRAEKVRKGEV